MEALNTVTEGPSNTESFAYRAMLVAARSYVAVLVLVSLLAVVSSVLGAQAQIVNSEIAGTDTAAQATVGDLLFSGGTAIPFVGLPAVWLAEDQTWFTAWVIITMIASMLSIPGPIRAFAGSRRPEVGTEEVEVKPGVNRRLVAISAWPLLLLLLVTLPLA